MPKKTVTRKEDYQKYVGKQVKIKSNHISHHGFIIGETVTVTTAGTNGWFTCNSPRIGSYSVAVQDLFLGPVTREEIEQSIIELEDEIKIKKLRLAFLDEVKAGEFDEDEFKAYSILKLVEEGNLSTYEKSKKIAELVRG